MPSDPIEYPCAGCGQMVVDEDDDYYTGQACSECGELLCVRCTTRGGIVCPDCRNAGEGM